MKTIQEKLAQYGKLIKSLQTALLLATGLAGYMSAQCPVFHLTTLVGVATSLFLAISGSTLLNMWYDRDIDAKMQRTCTRPLASGKIDAAEVLRVGLLLSIAGVGLALWIDGLYGIIVFAGLFFDVIVYTVWLKRRSCWAILWGGISGGMPVLAGRALGVGSIDWIALALCLGILFWIPTHIMTFSMRYQADYQSAGIPTFPAVYSLGLTRILIAASSVLAALMMGWAAWGIGMLWGHLVLLALLSAGLILLAISSLIKPSERANFSLFKYASIYMLSAMILMMI